MFKQTKVGYILNTLLFSPDITSKEEILREKVSKLTKQDIEKAPIPDKLKEDLFQYKIAVLTNQCNVLDCFCSIYDEWEDVLINVVRST
ncbi:MAG: hypothetical protein QXU98_13720 [Candidatus Parvarchaeota archaeon]